MTIKIVPNDKGNPPGETCGRGTALHFGTPRRVEADWLRAVGTSRWGAKRDVPGEAILGQRGTTFFCSVATLPPTRLVRTVFVT